MAWTAPRTWVIGEQVTAALMNSAIRDNFLETSAATVTTAGDLAFADAANSMGSRLAIGAVDTVLVSSGAAPTWSATVGSVHSVASHNDTSGTGTELDTLTDGSNADALHNHSGVVFADNADSAVVDISEVTDVTIKTRDVTGVAVGDLLSAELRGTLLQDSGTNRSITFTPDFDNDFDPEVAVTLSNTSDRAIVLARWDLVVVSTSVAHMNASILTLLQTAAGTYRNAMASSDWNMVYDDSVNDLTGTITVSFKIRSASATATQDFLVHSFVIRKIPST